MKPMKHAMVMMTSLVVAGGCIDDSRDADLVQPLPEPMASAERDGARVDIYELTPGDLAVVATGELPEEIEGKTPVEIYEVIAGAAAPAALVERQVAIARVQAQHPRDHVGSSEIAAAPARAQHASLTATQFQSAWCNPGAVDFDYCWLNRTNNYSTTFFNIRWIHSHVNAYSGTLTHNVLYRAFAGSWNLIDTDTTTGSSYVSSFNEQANGDYEVELTNAAGDGYHLSLHGDF